jgi:hypothetical protein
MRKLAILLLLLLFASLLAQPLLAQEETEDTSTNSLLLQISSLPEAKLGFTHRYKFPFLQGDGPLTKDNNINLGLTAEISPISLNGIVEAIWTPIAFFEFSAGGRIGSGWNINLFGGDVYGIGVNKQNADGSGEINGSAFDGLLWKAQVGGALQFDLAAVIPGDWNHVVFRSYHEINYKGYTKAKGNEAWFFENDDGENCNGFNYYGNFLLGYQMPIFLDMVAFLAEMDLFLYDTPNRTAWGDDLIRWTFSSVLSFTITKKFSIVVITQFRTRRNWNESNWEDLHYRSRTVDTSNPQHLEFYRVAGAFLFKF